MQTSKVKERGITFSGSLPQAIRDGIKTMTRRVINPQPARCAEGPRLHTDDFWRFFYTGGNVWKCPYGAVGDLFYVREAYYQFGHWEPVEGAKTKGGKQKWVFVPDSDFVVFNVFNESEIAGRVRLGRHHKDPATPAWHKRLARFMPRKYSRTTVEITGIGIERLQDISEEDAIAEGIESDVFDQTVGYRDYSKSNGWFIDWPGASYGTAGRESFKSLYESIHGPGSWERNEWVWKLEFRKI